VRFGQLYLQGGWSAMWVSCPELRLGHPAALLMAHRRGPQRGLTYGMLWWVSDASPAAFFTWGYGG
jgi:hypothetical protein